MTIYNVDITFKTPVPLSQEVGKQLWMMATDFGSVGASTYRWQAFEPATDLATVQTEAMNYISRTILQENRDWTPSMIEFTRVGVSINEPATKLARQL